MADLKKQSTEELTKMLNEKREAQRNFRFAEAGSRSRNVREGRGIRREIAQILTELRSRAIALKASLAPGKKSA